MPCPSPGDESQPAADGADSAHEVREHVPVRDELPVHVVVHEHLPQKGVDDKPPYIHTYIHTHCRNQYCFRDQSPRGSADIQRNGWPLGC